MTDTFAAELVSPGLREYLSGLVGERTYAIWDKRKQVLLLGTQTKLVCMMPITLIRDAIADDKYQELYDFICDSLAEQAP